MVTLFPSLPLSSINAEHDGMEPFQGNAGTSLHNEEDGSVLAVAELRLLRCLESCWSLNARHTAEATYQDYEQDDALKHQMLH